MTTAIFIYQSKKYGIKFSLSMKRLRIEVCDMAINQCPSYTKRQDAYISAHVPLQARPPYTCCLPQNRYSLFPLVIKCRFKAQCRQALNFLSPVSIMPVLCPLHATFDSIPGNHLGEGSHSADVLACKQVRFLTCPPSTSPVRIHSLDASGRHSSSSVAS